MISFFIASKGFDILYLFLLADLFCCAFVFTIFYSFFDKRINEKTAYFSSSTLESGNYQTAVYKTNIKDNTWQKTTYFHLTDSYNAANIQFLKEESAIYFTASEKNKNQK